MAAGAIPPPLFFERRRLLQATRSENGFFTNTRKPNRVGRRIERLTSISPASRDGPLLKDI